MPHSNAMLLLPGQVLHHHTESSPDAAGGTEIAESEVQTSKQFIHLALTVTACVSIAATRAALLMDEDMLIRGGWAINVLFTSL